MLKKIKNVCKNQWEGVRRVAMTSSSAVPLENCFTHLTPLKFLQ